ncbi:MAG: SDR family oxidoreductase [Clostridiales bacterium]|uniref:SDR family oxidoreductase n=1 Tax=Clostridium sp. N3C TaxID=1776758 RepID=UPI00092DEEAB|nr:SDR family oxidoreductase [Clostridium sp. N3C]NLZ48260.1 SDR family oxidoreductase [Clostridiales bacterium]SCN25897.1 Cyclopentanol dehydrogenase [Clostridium sp. N3C]
MENKKKVVLITGASSGIGKATAIYLASKGLVVYGTSRKVVDDEELKKYNINMLKMDVGDEESVKQAINELILREGRIDSVFNNAGSGISGPLEETSIEEYKELFESNFFGMIRVVKEVLPHMRKAGKGLIINSSSIGGVIGLPYQGVYSSTKFAVEGFSEALSKELKPFGIKVVILEPGDFKTDFTKNRRFSSLMSKNSAYYDDFIKTVSVFEYDEIKGCNPEMIGKLLYKIINSNNPKLRYPIGYFNQKLSLLLKKFLPERIFEKIIINYYMGKGIKSNKELERIDKRIKL